MGLGYVEVRMMTLYIRIIKDDGFTLIELMITVTILGILMAVAVPNYLSFQFKAKTAEALHQIDNIRVVQEAYKAEYDVYLACLSSPGPQASAMPGKRAWINTAGAGAGFDAIGFSPMGAVYYNFEVSIDPTGSEMAIGAEGDLDGNGLFAYLVYSTDGVTGAYGKVPAVTHHIENITPREF